MSIRSLLTAGLLAIPALAGPLEARAQKTVTVTSVSTKTKFHTVTDHETIIKEKTKTKTVTKTATATITDFSTAPGTTVTATTTASASCSITSAPSGTSGSTSGTSTSSGNGMTTTLTATAKSSKGLNDYAKATGKTYFGTAADIPGTGEQQDKYYMQELNNTHDFGQLTPANVMKWYSIEPEQNVFDYTAADEFVAIAKANKQLIRCHNLNWYNQNPDWLTDGTWTNETILAALVNHINNTVAHFGDDCYAWDVVNEAFNDDGTYREDIWYNTTGTSYIFTAFAAAEAVVKANNLKVKLYYNDYNIEYLGNKSYAAQNLVKEIKARGIQIDGVGLQSHFIIGETPSESAQMANMAAFTTLGVDVAITELDVRGTTPVTLAEEEQQVIDYANSVGACANTARCVGVTVWDFDDTYSWIPSTFAGQGYGDLFFQPGGADTPLVRKAAYDGCIDGLTGVVPTLGST